MACPAGLVILHIEKETCLYLAPGQLARKVDIHTALAWLTHNTAQAFGMLVRGKEKRMACESLFTMLATEDAEHTLAEACATIKQALSDM